MRLVKGKRKGNTAIELRWGGRDQVEAPKEIRTGVYMAWVTQHIQHAHRVWMCVWRGGWRMALTGHVLSEDNHNYKYDTMKLAVAYGHTGGRGGRE